MRLLSICLLNIFCLALFAEDQPAEVTKHIEKFLQEVSIADEERQEAIEEIEQAYAKDVAKAQKSALRNLKRLTNRRLTIVEEAAIYRAILQLDQTDNDAVQFFTSIGNIDEVLSQITPLVEKDFTGNVFVTEQAKPKLLIEEALYGANDKWLDIRDQVTVAMNEESGLRFHLTNQFAGSDPAPGVRKSLKIVFRFGKLRWEEQFNEGQEVAMTLENFEQKIMTLRK